MISPGWVQGDLSGLQSSLDLALPKINTSTAVIRIQTLDLSLHNVLIICRVWELVSTGRRLGSSVPGNGQIRQYHENKIAENTSKEGHAMSRGDVEKEIAAIIDRHRFDPDGWDACDEIAALGRSLEASDLETFKSLMVDNVRQGGSADHRSLYIIKKNLYKDLSADLLKLLDAESGNSADIMIVLMELGERQTLAHALRFLAKDPDFNNQPSAMVAAHLCLIDKAEFIKQNSRFLSKLFTSGTGSEQVVGRVQRICLLLSRVDQELLLTLRDKIASMSAVASERFSQMVKGQLNSAGLSGTFRDDILKRLV